MRIGQYIACVLLSVAFLAVGCTMPIHDTLTPDENLEQVTLQLRWYHQFQFAGYYAAVEQGYYRDLGLDVRIEESIGSVPNPLQVVRSGEAEYGVATTDVLLAYAEGAPVTVLAAIFQHSPWAIAVRTDRNIRTPHDLVGHTLVFPQGPRTAELQAMILDEGISLSDLELIDVPSKFPDYLFDEGIDGYSLYLPNEPYLLEQRQMDMFYLRPFTYGIDFYGDLLFTSKDELRRHPDRVRRFREASLRGWQYALEHPEEMVDVILRDYGSNKSRAHLLYEADQISELVQPQLVQLGHMNPGRWQHIADTYVRLGMMEPISSFEDFLYNPIASPSRVIYWGLGIIGGALVVTLLIAGTLLIFNRRLQILVQLHTQRLAEQNQALTAEIETRKRVEDELRTSEAQFRAVWENASDAMAISDADGTVLDANPAYYDLYQLTESTVVGHNFAVIFPESVRTEANLQYKQVFAQAEPVNAYESTILRGDGIERIVESRIGFLNLGSGQVVMLSTVRDITERKRLEDRVRQTQKMEALGTLAGGIAHDFNNILLPIITYTELTMRSLPQDSPLQRNLTRILSAGEQAKNLVQQILAFSRSTGLERTPLDLHPLLQEVVNLVRIGLSTKVTIDLDSQSGLGYVLANSGQIHQVVMNLCTNAYQSIGDSQGNIRVRLRRVDALSEDVLKSQGGPAGCFLKLTITDTGSGMDAETMQRIFDPFFTTKEVGKGTGLGLSVVHGIVQSMKGTIDVQSKLGLGSTLTIYLPCTEAPTLDSSNAPQNLTTGSARILLVDDSRDVLVVMADLLETLEYHVVTQEKSLAAFEYWRTHRGEIDLIILDQSMPELKGTEFITRVRAIDATIPIVLMSGYSQQITATSGQAQGATLFISKPITTQVLQSAIQEALQPPVASCV